MKKLQVFVSSTYLDLIDERQKAVEGILRSGHIPAGMELFNAANENQWEVIKDWITESDVLMLILGGKFGSIEKTSGKSYTQLEYEYALNQKIPVFAIVLSDQYLADKKSKNINTEVYEYDVKDPQISKYNDFKNLVEKNAVRFVNNIDNITSEISFAMQDYIQKDKFKYYFKGWIRGNSGEDHILQKTEQNIEIQDNVVTSSTKKFLNDRLNEEKVVWLLPRGFLLLTQITYSSNPNWSSLASYYDYNGEFKGATHYHSSYRNSSDEALFFDFKKLNIPEGDWEWAFRPLRFLRELRNATEKSNIQEQTDYEDFYYKHVYYVGEGEDIEVPVLPLEYKTLNRTGKIRDNIAEIREFRSYNSYTKEEITIKAKILKQSVYLNCISDLGETNPSLSFIEEVLNEYNSKAESSEISLWLDSLEAILNNTLKYEYSN
ncbi:DUF4062 domain-containing protein [Rossellomorea marisflavi]|uniref:DUF4062 domain-containing protein n=1 Tax=Rossellomorea marisflavi TaxID=189381 RepID=UPI0011E66B84|nr:DUF4062 domain-containing protein [Rossellomorea marisflavi]TYO69963.1 DUF4062 domain-containing protein [Rossellomorea marisflavi]